MRDRSPPPPHAAGVLRRSGGDGPHPAAVRLRAGPAYAAAVSGSIAARSGSSNRRARRSISQAVRSIVSSSACLDHDARYGIACPVTSRPHAPHTVYATFSSDAPSLHQARRLGNARVPCTRLTPSADKLRRRHLRCGRCEEHGFASHAITATSRARARALAPRPPRGDPELSYAEEELVVDYVDQLVAHPPLPLEHRKRTRSTNLLECTFIEVRRRTKIIGRILMTTMTVGVVRLRRGRADARLERSGALRRQIPIAGTVMSRIG